MQTSRRNFIKLSGLASASLLVPQFISASTRTGNPFNGKILVVIQLSGGNDGLNCVVPFKNDLYYRYRPQLGLQNDELIKITSEAALNKSLQPLADLYHDDSLCILNGVGYPNPNRSHFRSMDIWQSASGSEHAWNTGWIGRALDSNCETCNKPYSAIELDTYPSLVMEGETKTGFCFNNYDSLQQTATENKLISQSNSQLSSTDNSNVAFLHKTLSETEESVSYLIEKGKTFSSHTEFPQTEFGKKLQLISTLICSGSETTFYYASLSGFDTHVFQKNNQNNSLETYSSALKSFCNDLKKNSRWKDVMVLTFSEFGRRVKQNASRGTDHGTANVVFVAGGNLKKQGLYNSLPDLENLQDGDLIHQVDFRSVYATMLNNWLNINPSSVLKNDFPLLSFT